LALSLGFASVCVVAVGFSVFFVRLMWFFEIWNANMAGSKDDMTENRETRGTEVARRGCKFFNK
jgi:hypothetical protein